MWQIVEGFQLHHSPNRKGRRERQFAYRKPSKPKGRPRDLYWPTVIGMRMKNAALILEEEKRALGGESSLSEQAARVVGGPVEPAGEGPPAVS